MNNKLMSYEELIRELKHLEGLQRIDKGISKDNGMSMKTRKRFQKIVEKNKKEINLVLTAIYHAKQARKFYEYKRIYESEKLRGLCTDNYVEGE